MRKSLLGLHVQKEEEFEEKLEQRISENKEMKPELVSQEAPYIVKIPPTAKKQDLGKLKDFLITQKPGAIAVFILLPS